LLLKILKYACQLKMEIQGGLFQELLLFTFPSSDTAEQATCNPCNPLKKVYSLLAHVKIYGPVKTFFPRPGRTFAPNFVNIVGRPPQRLVFLQRHGES
jgi:hypothetical protein